MIGPIIFVLILVSVFIYITPLYEILIDAIKSHRVKKTAAISKKDADFSWPAQQILKSYDSLPTENQPRSRSEFENALRALDTKYEKAGVNAHFSYDDYYSHSRPSVGTWKCCCVDYISDRSYERYRRKLFNICQEHPEYVQMRDGIMDIKNAIAEREVAYVEAQKRAILAGMQADLLSVESLTQALRDERKILTAVTKEIEQS